MLKAFSLVQLHEILLNFVENKDFEVEFSSCINIQGLLALIFFIPMSKRIQIFLISIFENSVVGFDPHVIFHRFLQFCCQDLSLLLNRPGCLWEGFVSWSLLPFSRATS